MREEEEEVVEEAATLTTTTLTREDTRTIGIGNIWKIGTEEAAAAAVGGQRGDGGGLPVVDPSPHRVYEFGRGVDAPFNPNLVDNRSAEQRLEEETAAAAAEMALSTGDLPSWQAAPEAPGSGEEVVASPADQRWWQRLMRRRGWWGGIRRTRRKRSSSGSRRKTRREKIRRKRSRRKRSRRKRSRRKRSRRKRSSSSRRMRSSRHGGKTRRKRRDN